MSSRSNARTINIIIDGSLTIVPFLGGIRIDNSTMRITNTASTINISTVANGGSLPISVNVRDNSNVTNVNASTAPQPLSSGTSSNPPPLASNASIAVTQSSVGNVTGRGRSANNNESSRAMRSVNAPINQRRPSSGAHPYQRPVSPLNDAEQKVQEYIYAEVVAGGDVFTHHPQDIKNFKGSSLTIIMSFFDIIQQYKRGVPEQQIPRITNARCARRVIERWLRNRTNRFDRLFHKSDMNLRRENRRRRQQAGATSDCNICLMESVHSVGCAHCNQQVGCLGCCKTWVEGKLSNRNTPSCPLCRADWAAGDDILHYGETN